jgi:hypothetical protein
VVVLAKQPRAGSVKTRLCPPFSHAEAAQLALAALADTLAAVRSAVPLAHSREHRLDPVLALDGRPGAWLDALRVEAPVTLRVIAQRSGTLDARIAGAFRDATTGSAGSRTFLIGMDTPQVTPEILVDAIDELCAANTDAVMGLAEDGGWWGLGLNRPAASLILGVPTSTPHTGRDQHDRLTAAGLQVTALPMLRDVDTAADAHHVAALVPDSRFASTLARLSIQRVPALLAATA